MACKSLLAALLMLLTLTFGDAKGGGRSGGRSFYHSSGGGSHNFYSGQAGGGGMYNHSSYYGHDGGRGGGRSSEGPLIALIVLVGIAIIVLYIRLLLVLKEKQHGESSQDTKTTPLYYRTTKDRRVDEEYDSEIARYCAEESVIPKADIKLPSSGAWNGTYTEKGVTYSSSYDLTFDETGNSLVAIAVVVLFIRLFAVMNEKHAEASQDTKTTPLYDRTTKNHSIDKEYDSEIAQQAETAIPKDVKLPSSCALV